MGYSPRGRKESDTTEQLHSQGHAGEELLASAVVSLMFTT